MPLLLYRLFIHFCLLAKLHNSRTAYSGVKGGSGLFGGKPIELRALDTSIQFSLLTVFLSPNPSSPLTLFGSRTPRKLQLGRLWVQILYGDLF